MDFVFLCPRSNRVYYVIRVAVQHNTMIVARNVLEALPVHYRRSRLVVLLLADPHLLERRQRGEYRAADPDRVLPLGRSDDLDFV